MSAELRTISAVLFTLAPLALAGTGAAQTVADRSRPQPIAPTFYADALSVFYKNCVACHQPDGPNVGGIKAPMSLTTYQDARRWWFDNSADHPNNPDPTADVVYGPATTDEMANARIYFAPTKPQHIVVGEPIPQELLQQARDAEARRRRRAQPDGT